jgi:PCFT/HCP family folate transporter-like MFS transporter 1/3
MDASVPSEASALLDHQLTPPGHDTVSKQFRKAPSPRKVGLLLATVIFFITVGTFLSVVPITRLLEDSICRRYYHDDRSRHRKPIDENMCKVGEIQSELAYILGILSMLEAIPGMLLLCAQCCPFIV